MKGHLTALEAYLCHMYTSAKEVNGDLWDAVIPATQSSRKDYVIFLHNDYSPIDSNIFQVATVLLLLHTYSTSIEHRVTLPPYLPSARRARQRLLHVVEENIRDVSHSVMLQDLAWLHWYLVTSLLKMMCYEYKSTYRNAYIFGLTTVIQVVGDIGKTLSETFGQFAYAAIPEPTPHNTRKTMRKEH